MFIALKVIYLFGIVILANFNVKKCYCKEYMIVNTFYAGSYGYRSKNNTEMKTTGN